MTWTFGDVSVERVVELAHWEFPVPAMFPTATTAHWPEPTVDFCIAVYVVRAPGLTLLVDAGNGNAKTRPVLAAHDGFATDFLDRLGAVVAPDDVDVVVCTHLHPDHCGGLTRLVDGVWTPTFPRARHLVPAAELAWLQELAGHPWPHDQPEADLARTWHDSVAPVLAAGTVETVEVPLELAPGVTVAPAPGHTAGHVVVEIDAGGEHAVVTGDALHHPLQFADLGVGQSGDADPEQAHRTRRGIVDRLVARDGLLLPAHFAPGRLGHGPAGLSYTPV